MPKHILCADDSVTMQKVVAITFAHTDYQVTSARSADDALAIAKQRRPDLVLADAVMPGKTGYDLCQALKGDPALRAVPVVILCGNSQAYDEGRGKQVGADAFLAKPWDTQIFLDKIGEILARTAQHGVAQIAHVPQSTMTPIPARPATAPPPASPLRTLSGTGPAISQQPGPSLVQPRPVGPPPAAGVPRPAAPQAATAARAPDGLPKPPPGLPRPPVGLPRPPLIRGATTSPRPVGAGPSPVRPAAPGSNVIARPIGQPGATAGGTATQPQAAAAAAAARAANARSATIMGMPAMALPPASPSMPVSPVGGPPPVAPPLTARPIPVTPIARPIPPSPAPVAPPAAPTPPPVAVAQPARPLPGADALAEAAKRVAAAGVLATREAAQAQGLDPRGVQYDAIARLSREVIEQIAWEVVPQLAEIIIRENLDKMRK
jgi:CheY-like chemotaxis protein